MQLFKDKNYVSIVVNVGSKAKSITHFLTELDEWLVISFFEFEYIFVSNDAKAEILKEIKEFFIQKNRHASLINIPYEINKEQAILIGADASIGDFVFEFEDMEMDYTVSDLSNLYEASLEGYDIVVLKPHYEYSWSEKLFHKLLNKHSNKHIIAHPTRVNLVSRRLINRVNSVNKMIVYRKFAYSNVGLSYKCVKYKSSRGRYKKIISFSQVDFATDLLLMFTNLGKKIALFLSFLFGLAAAIACIYTLVVYFTMDVVQGWTTLMLFLSISFMGVFLCFSMVIKYLYFIFNNSVLNVYSVGVKEKL